MGEKLRYSNIGGGYKVGYNPEADIKSIEDITFNGTSIMSEFSDAMYGIKVYFGNKNFDITSTDAMISGMKEVVKSLNSVESCFHVLECSGDRYIAQFDEYYYAKQFITSCRMEKIAYVRRVPRNIPSSLNGVFVNVFRAMFSIYKEYEFTKEDLDIIWKCAIALSCDPCDDCCEKYECGSECDSREAFNDENSHFIDAFNKRFNKLKVDENTYFCALKLVSKIVDAKRCLDMRQKEWDKIKKEMKRYEV